MYYVLWLQAVWFFICLQNWCVVKVQITSVRVPNVGAYNVAAGIFSSIWRFPRITVAMVTVRRRRGNLRRAIWLDAVCALWLLLMACPSTTREGCSAKATPPHEQEYAYTGQFNLTKRQFLEWSPVADSSFPVRKFVVILATRRGASTATVRRYEACWSAVTVLRPHAERPHLVTVHVLSVRLRVM